MTKSSLRFGEIRRKGNTVLSLCCWEIVLVVTENSGRNGVIIHSHLLIPSYIRTHGTFEALIEGNAHLPPETEITKDVLYHLLEKDRPKGSVEKNI